MSDFIKNFIEEVKTNTPGYVATAVADVKTGVLYGSDSAVPSFDPAIASVYNLEVAKAKMTAIKALGLDSKLENILINLNNQIHIIDLAEDGSYFVYLAVDSSKANLGMTMALLNKYKKNLKDKL
ncbi:hypothetical protein [Flavobacterium sp. U410]|jgi:hypothetical protein